MGLISKSQARLRGFTFYFFFCVHVRTDTRVPRCSCEWRPVRLDSKSLSAKPLYLSAHISNIFYINQLICLCVCAHESVHAREWCPYVGGGYTWVCAEEDLRYLRTGITDICGMSSLLYTCWDVIYICLRACSHPVALACLKPSM